MMNYQAIITLIQNFAATAGAACTPSGDGGSLFGFPHWYDYLKHGRIGDSGECIPGLQGISDVWLIVAAIIEILLRVAAIVAVAFVVYGAISMVTSQGGEGATKARNTVINSLIGLAIAIMAAAIVTFVAGRLT